MIGFLLCFFTLKYKADFRDLVSFLEHIKPRQSGTDHCPVLDSDHSLQPDLAGNSCDLHPGHGVLDIRLSVLADLDPAVQKVSQERSSTQA